MDPSGVMLLLVGWWLGAAPEGGKAARGGARASEGMGGSGFG
jgi:hypothetical protein